MTINKREQPRRSILGSVIAAVLAGAGSIGVQAQETADSETEGPSVQEITDVALSAPIA